jgi:ATP-binding cassette subfamily B protein
MTAEIRTPPRGSRGVLLALGRRFAPFLAALVALEVVDAGLLLVEPIPLQVAVDSAVHGEPLPGWMPRAVGGPGLLPALAVLGVLLAILTRARSAGSGILSTLAGERMILALRRRIFAAALRLAPARHAERGAADTLYRIQSDAQTIEWILVDVLLPVSSALLSLAAILGALFRLSPALFAVALGVAPPLFLATHLVQPALKAGAGGARDRESRALSVVEESLGALAAVKAFGREEAEAARFEALGAEAVRAHLRVAWLDGLLGAGVHLVCIAGSAIAFYLALRQAISGELSLGRALLGLHYVGQVYGPLKALGRKLASYEVQLAGLDRAVALLDEAPDVPPPSHPLPFLGRARGELALQGVTFGYDPRRPVLDGATLAVAAGERVGIVGETGAGKSTLLALLLRFHDPLAGRILLDGEDLRRLHVADVRRQLAVVFQDTVLFPGTIAENIAVGRPGASVDEIEAAARAANLHEAVIRLPDGYATPVGERGLSLSGGERQRVGLARAFLRDAPILILDEPTSALDPAAEAAVIEAIERLSAGRTVLTITHRRRALHGCDRVVRLRGGKLHEEVRLKRPRPPPGAGST